eukprot:14051034-Alexandrium_andersonii.AAC.1
MPQRPRPPRRAPARLRADARGPRRRPVLSRLRRLRGPRRSIRHRNPVRAQVLLHRARARAPFPRLAR